MLFNSYKDNLLDKPSLIRDECVICGRPATDKHHVIQKGMGGVSKQTEKRIPLLALCRSCHNEVHQKRLHINWRNGWLYLRTMNGMADDKAWNEYEDLFTPMLGWKLHKLEELERAKLR